MNILKYLMAVVKPFPDFSDLIYFVAFLCIYKCTDNLNRSCKTTKRLSRGMISD